MTQREHRVTLLTFVKLQKEMGQKMHELKVLCSHSLFFPAILTMRKYSYLICVQDCVWDFHDLLYRSSFATMKLFFICSLFLCECSFLKTLMYPLVRSFNSQYSARRRALCQVENQSSLLKIGCLMPPHGSHRNAIAVRVYSELTF